MGALDGINVVEAGLLVQGPQAAATMQAWGANVIKVELPGLGDQARWVFLAPDDQRSGYFTANNRGKRSITLDLRVPQGRDVFLRLMDQADVLITNFTPGTMEGWGLGYDEVAARNPRLVYAAASTFGPVGPDAHRGGADLSAQAAGGIISTTGAGEPSPVGATIADHVGSQNLLAGVLAALYARERTGRGQRIDTSLLGGQIWAQASEITAHLMTGQLGGLAERTHPWIPGIYGIFPTQDGWIAVVGITGSDRQVFFELLGRPELGEEFPQLFLWPADKAALFPRIADAFVARTTAAWCERLAAAGLRHAEVRDHAEVVADPGARVNGYLVDLDGTTVVAPPVRFSDTPPRVESAAPELGQHTEEILLELGYEWEDIAALQDAQVI
ncbi:MAG: CaiB/BaiF CoA transferase family protein [Acidimicrobiales bacterium]